MNMHGEQCCRYGDPVKSELDPLAVQHASRVNSAINNHEGQFTICVRELTGFAFQGCNAASPDFTFPPKWAINEGAGQDRIAKSAKSPVLN